MPMLAWSSHADGSVDFVNQQWRDHTGLSTEESHGPGWKDAGPALSESKEDSYGGT
jgi:hypothetical protein